MKNKLYRIVIICGLVIIGCNSFTPASSLTYQDTVNVSFTFNPTLSISLSDPSLTIDNLTPSSSSDSNIVTVSVSTNAGYGYYMSATAGTKTTNTNLTNTDNSNYTFTSLSSNVSSLSNIPDNNWGYSYSTDDGTTWISGDADNASTGYNGLPLDNDDSGATGIKLISTDTFSNSGSIKFKIGAKAAATQAAGTYTNTVNFYAVANPEPTPTPVACEAGKICYNINALTGAEGTMGKQELDDSNNAITDNSTVTLLASNFSRTGYGFAGWSDTYDYTGNLYGPQETITTPTGTSTDGLSLYAIWIKSQGSIQDQSKVASVCNSLTTAPTDGTANLTSVSALTDQRDNNTYAVARLADGNCWMIENLRLESTAEHNSDGTLAQGYGTSATYGNFGGLADAESSGFTYTYIANSLYYSDTQEGTASIDIGTSDYPGYRMPRYNNLNTSTRASNPTSNTFPNNTTGGMYSYGNYYTWHAAIADLTYNGTNNQSTTGTSLCPAGWHLPKGGNRSNVANNELWSLVVDGINSGTKPANYDSTVQPYYNGTPEGSDASNKLRAYPNNFLYSGDFGTSSAYSRGSYGFYWSSTANYDLNSYFLCLSSSFVYPGTDYDDKYSGLSIRCTVGT